MADTDQSMVGVRFTEAGVVSYCRRGDVDLGIGDYVVVQTDRGERLGWVVIAPDQVLASEHQGPMRLIDRLATDRTRIICDWLFHPAAISAQDFDPSGAVEFWNMTNEQDWHVSELSQQGISSRAYTPGPYSELESMIAAWDREYIRALGEGGS